MTSPTMGVTSRGTRSRRAPRGRSPPEICSLRLWKMPGSQLSPRTMVVHVSIHLEFIFMATVRRFSHSSCDIQLGAQVEETRAL